MQPLQNLKRFLALLQILILPAVLAVAHSRNYSPNSKSDFTVAPQWQLMDLDDKPVKLSDFKGKVVVLNFWATWCAPCRKEIPTFVALQKQYGAKGLVIIGASLDQGGTKTVKPFVGKTGINYPVVLADQKTADAYGGIQVVPTTFVIDRQGKIVAKHEGDTDRAVFQSEIKSLLLSDDKR